MNVPPDGAFICSVIARPAHTNKLLCSGKVTVEYSWGGGEELDEVRVSDL